MRERLRLRQLVEPHRGGQRLYHDQRIGVDLGEQTVPVKGVTEQHSDHFGPFTPPAKDASERRRDHARPGRLLAGCGEQLLQAEIELTNQVRVVRHTAGPPSLRARNSCPGRITQFLLTIRRLLQGFTDDRCTGIPIPGQYQQLRQIRRNLCPHRRIVGKLSRLAQMRCRRRIHQHLLSQAQFVQQHRTQAYISGLGQRPLQIGHSALGRAAAHRPRRRRPQPVHDLN
jgi:hypothetical protein